ncbi:MAG: hypothetical protein ACYDD7_00580 [Acidimicrobiales bacterium]
MIGDGTQVIDEAGRRHGWRRPLAIPDDVDQAPKATGVVELPLHVYWSGSRRTWDLRERTQLARVYELVMTEGTDEDVRRFIRVDELITLWPDLYLPAYVCQAWSDFLKRTRHVDLGC